MINNCNNESLVYTVKDIQVNLHIGKNKAYELVNSGIFPVVEIGNKKLIPKQPFLDWLNGGNVKVS